MGTMQKLDNARKQLENNIKETFEQEPLWFMQACEQVAAAYTITQQCIIHRVFENYNPEQPNQGQWIASAFGLDKEIIDQLKDAPENVLKFSIKSVQEKMGLTDTFVSEDAALNEKQAARMRPFEAMLNIFLENEASSLTQDLKTFCQARYDFETIGPS